MATATREELVAMAKLAEQADRGDEMVSFTKALVDIAVTKNELMTEEERNLLSVSYKNAVGRLRASLKALTAVEDKTTDDFLRGLAKKYKNKVFEDLLNKCKEIIKLLVEQLIPLANENIDSKAFFVKMLGDYYRYLAEPKIDANRQRDEHIANAQKAYEQATVACEILPPTHPVKLGLALNYSVMHYELLANPRKACELANSAFEASLAELDATKGDSYKDATLIMQLLRDNLTIWTDAADEQERM